jgi:hypothetical protein
MRIALALERRAHPFLTSPFVIPPGIVKEGDARVESEVDDLFGLCYISRGSEVVTAKTKNGHVKTSPAKGALGNLVLRVGLCRGRTSCNSQCGGRFNELSSGDRVNRRHLY